MPVEQGKVKIYTCGPTVYNYFHIGNARPFLVFDVLRRYFESCGYAVTFVQNFTDIDDRMITRANEEGITVQQLAERFIAEYFTDAKALGIRPATVHPKATEHIPQIIALIDTLIHKGLAYTVDGDVYYRVHAFPRYGILCGQESGGSGKRRARERGRTQGRPVGFCLVESAKTRRTRLGKPLGHGETRLAY